MSVSFCRFSVTEHNAFFKRKMKSGNNMLTLKKEDILLQLSSADCGADQQQHGKGMRLRCRGRCVDRVAEAGTDQCCLLAWTT